MCVCMPPLPQRQQQQGGRSLTAAADRRDRPRRPKVRRLPPHILSHTNTKSPALRRDTQRRALTPSPPRPLPILPPPRTERAPPPRRCGGVDRGGSGVSGADRCTAQGPGGGRCAFTQCPHSHVIALEAPPILPKWIRVCFHRWCRSLASGAAVLILLAPGEEVPNNVAWPAFQTRYAPAHDTAHAPSDAGRAPLSH